MDDALTPAQREELEQESRAARRKLMESLQAGDYPAALKCAERNLQLQKRLYPGGNDRDGHPDLAASLNNMGFVLNSLGQPEKARPHYADALDMYRRLFPTEQLPGGHPDLAASLNNMGSVLGSLGQPEKARPYYADALEMRRRLFPTEEFPGGHPDLATSLNNMGFVLGSLGQPEKARPHYADALDMYRRLFPTEQFPGGHPDLAASLNNMGSVLESLGQPEKAAPYFGESITIRLAVLNRAAFFAPDAATSAGLRDIRSAYAGLLSVVLADSAKLAAAYAHLWPTRAPLLTALRARHDAALAQRSGPAVREKWSQLTTVRAAISRLLTAATTDFSAREKTLADLGDEQDRLERTLAPLLPDLGRNHRITGAMPQEFAAKLPIDTAFVEFIRYRRRQTGVSAGDHYVAFVVVPGGEPVGIDLGPAEPIDDAVAAWRAHVEKQYESIVPAVLRELVWAPVAGHLPPTIAVVYLCPDGDLWRLPFAALPGKAAGTVLLDDFALAVIPSGLFLLEQLLDPPSRPTGGDVFVVGDVEYDTDTAEGNVFPRLGETGREARRVCEAFGLDPDQHLKGREATTRAIADGLCRARYAHIATHGYFDADALREERKRFDRHIEAWHAGGATARDRVGAGLRNPLGFVGLALAGANEPGSGGILTGLNIVDLPLEQIWLCVLSACETGLGELTEGEGVAGLQRAFHVAGCPNVVGSLWNVNDKATAALMAQFYSELRANEPPIQALRRAQLTIYRHPERIDELAGDRGSVNLQAPARLQSRPRVPNETRARAQTTPTKLWAAFILSGLGR